MHHLSTFHRQSSHYIRWTHFALLFLIVLSLSFSGCATTSDKTATTYKDQVEAVYEQAQRAFDRKNYIAAIEGYNTVRNKYPYSRFAALADLRLADAYFEQSQYISAAEQYRSFLRLYPTHEHATYAMYRIAVSFYEQIPSDWWFMPPAHEKDLTHAKNAVRELRVFLRHHADSDYGSDARRFLVLARRRLADHELYVAQFYIKKDNHKAAVNRLTYLLTHYSGVGLDPQSLFLLSKSYLALGDIPKAVTALEDLVEIHPTSDFAEEAQKMLQRYKS